MDYTRPLTDSENNPKVHIALILAPGVHKGHQNFSESPVLLNPGGPGGSGTMFAMVAAGMLQKMIDPTQDMIGFDPRGIGATTPRADCFSYPLGMSGDGFSDEDYLSGNYHRMLWRVAGLNTGLANSSSDALLKLHSEAMSMSKLCREKDDLYGENSIFKHINTPNVARDMISIIDAWDEWTSSLSKVSAPSQKREKDVQTKLEKSEVISTKPKLSYLGFSYGVRRGSDLEDFILLTLARHY
jgi:pimeloyl-ACP methyl ester carboxylesterase